MGFTILAGLLALGALNLQVRKMTDNITGGGKCGTGN